MEAVAVIVILVIVIISLIAFAVMQLKMAGIEIKDFYSFVKANENLDKLYVFSKKCNSMSPQEQVIFLSEAEKVFNAFDKIPDIIWEDEFKKYDEVLKKYKEIKMERWISN